MRNAPVLRMPKGPVRGGPKEAMALVKRIKSDPAIAHTYSQEVHKWYAQDKQQNIQAELAVLLGHAQGA